ncbi:hypothetical protein ACFWA4_16110 [Streptomyces sp. NPDC060011]|uniref:hypothetical protein n=1 Tax=Streptomyces sp. NPDC060011 TaxID=3347037 RepID=UPI0036B4F8B0
MDDIEELASMPSDGQPASEPEPVLGAPMRVRVLELIALVVSITLAAAALKVAGTTVAVAVVIGGGERLFRAWRSKPPHQ